jgi:hypothetical protein
MPRMPRPLAPTGNAIVATLRRGLEVPWRTVLLLAAINTGIAAIL